MDVTGAIIDDNHAVPEAFVVSFRDDKYYPLQLHAKTSEMKQEWVRSLRAGAGGRGRAAAQSPAASHSDLQPMVISMNQFHPPTREEKSTS